MNDRERRRVELGAAVSDADSALEAADRLCRVCLDLLPADGASISVMHEGTTRGTFGSSGKRSRWLDELQFTFGEGPSLDAVAHGRAVLVADLGGSGKRRWPAFTDAVLAGGICAVFAFPVTVASCRVGAFTVFRLARGPLAEEGLVAGLLTAELAALPLLDLMTSDVDWDAVSQGGDGWDQLASLERSRCTKPPG